MQTKAGTFRIEEVTPAPEKADYLGRISFTFVPDQFNPVVRAVRYDAKANNGDGGTFPVADFLSPAAVRIRSAFVRAGQRHADRPWCSCDGIDLPPKLSQAVAAAAMKRLARGSAEGQRPGEFVSDIPEEDIPF